MELKVKEQDVIEEKQYINLQEWQWSHSKLAMFDGCERQFFYKYIEKRPYPSNAPMQVGKIFHSAIELMIKEGYSPNEALYHSVGVNRGLPEGESASQIIWMLKRAYNLLPVDEYVEISSETVLKVKTTKGDFIGILDLIVDDPANDTTIIADFKSGWGEQDAEMSRQLALYAWLYKQTKGVLSSQFKGRLIFPRLDSMSEVDFDDAALDSAIRWAVGIINKISNKNILSEDDWKKANNRIKCDYCPFTGLCASGMLNGVPACGEPKDKEQAKEIGDMILTLEAAIKSMKNGLKSWVAANDSVQVGNGSWSLVQSEPGLKCSDTEALIDFAKRNGKDLKAGVKADSKTLKVWLDEDTTGELQQLVEQTKGRVTFKYEK